MKLMTQMLFYTRGISNLTNTLVSRLIKTPFTVFCLLKACAKVLPNPFFICSFSSMPSFSCASLPFHFPSKEAGEKKMLNPTHQLLKTLQRDGM